MKKIIFPLILLFTVLQFLVSCEIETSDNGKLDGQWHLVQVDTLQTGGVLDTSEKLIFWSFQMNLLQMRNFNHVAPISMARFSHAEGKLRVTQPCQYNLEHGNEYYTEETISTIAPYGINALEETFQVETLSGSRMTLCNGLLRLWFRKM